MGQLVSDITEVLDGKKTNSENESARKAILAQIASDEKNKTNLVKKTLATQRAGYGASGMGGKGLTESAVLKRLQGEVEQPFIDKKISNLEKMNKIKNPKNNLLKSLISRFDELMG